MSPKRMICPFFRRLGLRAVWGGSVIHRSGGSGFTFMCSKVPVRGGFRYGVKTYFWLNPRSFLR